MELICIRTKLKGLSSPELAPKEKKGKKIDNFPGLFDWIFMIASLYGCFLAGWMGNLLKMMIMKV